MKFKLPPIQFKRSHHSGLVPTANDLDVGELALNMPSQLIFTKDSDNNIIALGGEAQSSGNYVTAIELQTLNQSSYSDIVAAASNKVVGNLIVAPKDNVWCVTKVLDATNNVGILYRNLVEGDEFGVIKEYYQNSASTISKQYIRKYYFDGTDVIPQPTFLTFLDEAKFHSANSDIDLVDGDYATCEFIGLNAVNDKTIGHYWNADQVRWEAEGEYQFYTYGLDSEDSSELEKYWPASSTDYCSAKVFDISRNQWVEYISDGISWTKQTLTPSISSGLATVSSQKEIDRIPVGHAFVITGAAGHDFSLQNWTEEQANKRSNVSTRVNNTTATGIYNNYAADRQGEVRLYVQAQNAYSSSYDALHMIDGTSQGLLSNQTVHVNPNYWVNMGVSVQNTDSYFAPTKMFVRGRLSTSNDHMRQITWTAMNKDGETYSAVSTATTRTDYHYFTIPRSFYEDTVRPGLINIRLDCIKADTQSDYGGLWDFQFQKNLYAPYIPDGVYVKINNTGDYRNDILLIAT